MNLSPYLYINFPQNYQFWFHLNKQNQAYKNDENITIKSVSYTIKSEYEIGPFHTDFYIEQVDNIIQNKQKIIDLNLPFKNDECLYKNYKKVFIEVNGPHHYN